MEKLIKRVLLAGVVFAGLLAIAHTDVGDLGYWHNVPLTKKVRITSGAVILQSGSTGTNTFNASSFSGAQAFSGTVTATGNVSISSVTTPAHSTIQTINFSSHTIVPRSSFVLVSSTGNMVMTSSLAASISTVSVPSGFRLVLLSTASRISIPTVVTGGESAMVYSSTGGAYINVTTMTPVEFMWYGGFWRNISDLRP